MNKIYFTFCRYLASNRSFFFAISILFVNRATAQFTIEQNNLLTKYSIAKTDNKENRHLNFIVINPDVAALNKNNIYLLRTLSANAGIFYVDDSTRLAYLETNHFKYAVANDLWKLSIQLEKDSHELMQLKSDRKLFTLLVKNADSFIELLKSSQNHIDIKQVYKETNALVILCDPAILFKEIIQLNEVLFVDTYTAAKSDYALSGYYKTTNFISASDFFYPDDNGQGITIGIKEKQMDEGDIDLLKRVLPFDNTTGGNDLHATTIATLAGGAGNSFISGKGQASRCTFFSSSYANLFPDSTPLLLQNNVSVQNHSYGTIMQSFYGAEAMSYDLQTVQNKYLMHVFSCGNSGIDTPSTGTYAGLAGFANITGNFKMAKNVLTIAAIDTSEQIAPYSSSGPLYDGRIAPQLAALGSNGTSESAAIVSGTVAKLQQVYKDAHGQQLPPASLIKSVLLCTADDIGSYGIDYRSGFGALNVLRAMECLKNNNFDSSSLAQGDTWIKNIVIPPLTKHFKIALSWTDTAGTVNTYKALSNDLDLELKEIATGNIWHPWCLNTFPHDDSLMLPATRSRDSLNTVELITLDMPSAGAYEIKVIASTIITASMQDFNIAFMSDSIPSFRFVVPLQQSDFYLGNNKAEQIKIKWWSGSFTSSDMGTLSVSMDNGNTWEVLAASIPLSTQYFNWTVPDTNALIQFRMNTINGSYYSPQILLGPLTNLHTDYLCTDSFRLSWNSQPLAQSYQVFALTDSAYLKLIHQQTDTFIVMQRNEHPENIYAVQPVLNNNIKSVRSFAVDVNNQGSGCMYRSFYGIPVGERMELTIELDYPQGLDSVVIEKINEHGDGISTVENIIPNTSQYSYISYDESPSAGANNYRAKLWSAGHFVFSETISLLHTGKQWLFLYPNPTASGQPLYYVIKDSPSNLFLQLYSLQGIQIAEFPIDLSGSIYIPHFSSGMYYYQLINGDNEKLQQGKLMIF